ncbi:hypothetical protein BC938DRAFT_475103 [Jimgerdemannia flammicorona]|uniref:Uncharacterized protein n=1 Tax=Jimgerdemannia flammicorona TaxID=994334 RepID=A0A433QZE6_9FUNG|nr:hypothetical protein BC938DRAFT_475103 [Jimgerdemannia flammicorona]
MTYCNDPRRDCLCRGLPAVNTLHNAEHGQLVHKHSGDIQTIKTPLLTMAKTAGCDSSLHQRNSYPIDDFPTHRQDSSDDNR